jgi:putative protease
MRQAPEILAPAGSIEALKAAVNCGANAVYLGATQFSARQNAHNFDAATLHEATTLCHTNGVKVYLTVNTLILDTEWELFDQLLQVAADCGIDACIVQDLGAADYIHKRLPEMPLHASTQMTLYSPAGAEWAKAHGFSRVVVAREMTRSEIQAVCACGLEVEQFVHGALCMCLSGQCYLSAMIGARSANRGCCAQACRLPFTAKATRYPQNAALSLKDLCLLPHYQTLCEDGIASLKIEGRMKRPEYVTAAVTALRQLQDGRHPDLQTLRAVFSRSGFTDGYYTGSRANMFGTRQKEDVTAANTVLPRLAELAKKPSVHQPLSMTATVHLDQPVTLTASMLDGTSVTVKESAAEQAKNKPCDTAFLQRQLEKLGNTAYSLYQLTADCDGIATTSAASINSLRRAAVAELDALRLKQNTPAYTLHDVPALPPEQGNRQAPAYWVQVRTMEQLQAVQESRFPMEHLLIPLRLAEQTETVLPHALLVLPTFCPDDAKLQKRLQQAKQKGWTDLLCDTTAHLMLGKQIGFTLHGGTGLNITNRRSIQVLQQHGVQDVLLSPELTAKQGSHCGGILPTGIFAYGHFPVMKTRLCPIREEIGCRACTHQLKDRTGRQFPVYCTEHYTVLYNAVPIWMADQLSRLKGFSSLLLSFSIESPEQVQQVLNAYQQLPAEAPSAYTRGLLLRGLPAATGSI